MLTLLTLLALQSAVAQDDCGNKPVPVVADTAAALAVKPVRFKPAPKAAPAKASLPAGTLTLADLEAAFEALAQRGATLNDFFALLADGKARTLPGDVVRQALAKYGVSLPFLPVADLVQITSDGENLTVELDFGRKSSKKIKLPKTTSVAVSSTSSRDPYNVNSTRTETVSGERLLELEARR